MKNERTKMLHEALIKLQEIKNFYKDAYPGWLLIHSAQGFIKSVHHLECEGNFDEANLGVKEDGKHGEHSVHRELEIKDNNVVSLK